MSDSSPSNSELRETSVPYRAQIPDLEFPIAPDFVSRPPRLSPEEHLAWCEEVIRLGAFVPDAEKRLGEKRVTVEFVL